MSRDPEMEALQGRFPTMFPAIWGVSIGLLALALWYHSLFLGLLAPLCFIGGCAVVTILDLRRGDGPEQASGDTGSQEQDQHERDAPEA